jgi:hypothetical protein
MGDRREPGNRRREAEKRAERASGGCPAQEESARKALDGWAQFLQRVWRVDVRRCVHCGGRRVLLDVVEPDAIDAILVNLGLPRHCPVLVEARRPPSIDDIV